MNAAIFRGQDVPPPGVGGHNEKLCQFLECLLKDKSVQELFKRYKLDLASIAKCVNDLCWQPQPLPGQVAARPRLDSLTPAAMRWSDLPGMAEALRKIKP